MKESFKIKKKGENVSKPQNGLMNSDTEQIQQATAKAWLIRGKVCY